MMTISRNNYENYLLDYLEGKLTIGDSQKVQLFLKENPDIWAELNEFETGTLRNETYTIEKISLYKSFSDIQEIGPENFEEFCVAYYEGDLDAKSQERFITYIKKHPEVSRLFEQYKSLRLIPDKQIKFPRKAALRKYQITQAQKIFFVSLAASLILFLVFSVPRQNTKPLGLAEIEKVSDNLTEELLVYEPTISIEPVKTNPANKEIRKNEIIHNTIDSLSDKTSRGLIATREPIIIPIEVTGNPVGKIQMQASSNIIIADTFNQEIAENTRVHTRVKRDKVLMNLIKFGLNSFNSLTENELAFYTETNSEGKISEFALQNESFGISRKISKNIQN